MNYGLGSVISIDIKGFFDHVNHEKLMFFASKRIAAPYILKLIREWLRGGIVFEEKVTYPVEGTPQGGVISPLLANMYMNEQDKTFLLIVYDKKEKGSFGYRNELKIRGKCAKNSANYNATTVFLVTSIRHGCIL